jgi:hypothetical protein
VDPHTNDKQYSVRYGTVVNVPYYSISTVPRAVNVVTNYGTGINHREAGASIHLAIETGKSTGFYSEKASEISLVRILGL